MPIKNLLYKVPSWVVFLALFSPVPAFSDSVSTTGVQFLKIPAGVRGAGMGGMFTAVADDVSTTYWNTAGLAHLDKIELNFLHVSYFAGTNFEFAGFALPLAPGSTLGLSASFDFIPSFNSTNNPSAVPGTGNDLSLALGYGQNFGENLSLGIGGKFISSSLISSTATGAAVDAGLLLHTVQRDWTLGLSVQNVGQVSNFSQYSSMEKLPMVYRGGIVYRFQPQNPTHFLLGVDIEKPVDSGVILHSGAEAWIGSRDFSIAFRAGYALDPLNQDLGTTAGASLGAGVQFTGFELNYALVPFGVLGDTQRFSITYRFGTEEKPAPLVKAGEKNTAMDISPQVADVKTGTIKQATINLKPQARTDIKNWNLDITDAKGNIVRTYAGKGVPPKQIAWDGKDNNGNVVTGGLFSNVNFRTVDAGGQQVVASQPIFEVAQTASREAPLAPAAAPQPVEIIAPTLPEEIQPLGWSGVVKPPSLTFGENSYRINPAYLDYLNQVAQLIQRYPSAKVYIEGHAFEEGTEKEALALSQNRADSVLRYLVEKGKVSPDNLYSRGHGTSAPVDLSGTEESLGKNRRVDIVVLTK